MRVISDLSRKIVQDCFNRQNMLVHMGAKLTHIGLGEVILTLPKHHLALQHHGYFHGGIITTLADVVGGLAAYTYVEDEAHSCITVELKINFLHPCKAELLEGRGKVIKEGKGLMVSTAEIYSDGVLSAFLMATTKRIVPK